MIPLPPVQIVKTCQFVITSYCSPIFFYEYSALLLAPSALAMSKIATCLSRRKNARSKTLATKGTKEEPYISSCDEDNNIPRVENENKLDVDLNEAVISTGNSFDDLTGPLLAAKAPIFYSTIFLHP